MADHGAGDEPVTSLSVVAVADQVVPVHAVGGRMTFGCCSLRAETINMSSYLSSSGGTIWRCFPRIESGVDHQEL
ncbi:hypothetical protein PI124_g13907 [Phytophthora idaei]|nr:hypothetical protein PI125_g17180 [Phytophthora idaei]KAG3147092.1 hypothetical protein PI126_g13013 [Phytophthora idaei]KAG3241215.1 hypothetical protein PI124_g13907 [Phytophthora idaei]